MMSGKVPVESSWEFPGKSQQQQQVNKNNNHGHFMQRSSEELGLAIQF